MIKKLFSFYVTTLLIISESCFCMQPKDVRRVISNHKNLKTFFHENGEFVEDSCSQTDPTSPNIIHLLGEAALGIDHELVVEIVNALSSSIKNYQKLYAAIRAGKEGLGALKNLLAKKVSPHGYAEQGHDKTIVYALRTNVEKPSPLHSAQKIQRFKAIHDFLIKKGITEESSLLKLAVDLNNKEAITILKRYGARRPSDDCFIYCLEEYWR